jgi:hypothetical protein
MKKLVGLALAFVIGFVVVAPAYETEADAQVLLTLKCCDSYGNVRCVLQNWTPVGNNCFCYGQGWGYAC